MGDNITKLRWLILIFFVWSKLWRLRISYKKICFFHPRTVQLTVSNALVGRIIGRGGMKINSIQVQEYIYVYVCNRSLFHALMFRTFLSVIQCYSQLLRILKRWWLKDQSIIVFLKATSNKIEVRKESGCPPFHFLATTLVS